MSCGGGACGCGGSCGGAIPVQLQFSCKCACGCSGAIATSKQSDYDEDDVAFNLGRADTTTIADPLLPPGEIEDRLARGQVTQLPGQSFVGLPPDVTAITSATAPEDEFLDIYGPKGPGIHAPVHVTPPIAVSVPRDPTQVSRGSRGSQGEAIARRAARQTDAFVPGRGTVGVSAPTRFPVYTPGLRDPERFPRPILDPREVPPPNGFAIIDVTHRPPSRVPPIRGVGPADWMQGESSVALATLSETGPVFLGWSAYGNAVAPPDSRRFEEPRLAGPATLAPPHAGDFLLGGPDQPAGSGVGARAFPVPGWDGCRPWRPADEVAKRTEASDLDAFREPLPLRMPSYGIEGDSGSDRMDLLPGAMLKGVRAPASLAGTLSPPIHPSLAERIDLRRPMRVGQRLDSYRPMGGKLPAPSPVPAPPVAAPPAGPWDRVDPYKSPPPAPGVRPGEEVQAPPAVPEGEAPAPGGGSPRPGTPEIDAFKQAMRGGVPVDQWRTPKPEMPGAPGGTRGGKGANITSISSSGTTLLAAADQVGGDIARLETELRLRNLEPTESLGVTGRPGDAPAPPAEGRPDSEIRAELLHSRLKKAEIERALGDITASAGSQWQERAAEELEREQKARDREREREAKKRMTRPNYDEWATGKRTEEAARDVRGGANAIRAEAGRLDGDPVAAAGVRELSDKAKVLAKEADKAAKKAKNAAKFGTEKEAEAAAAKADEANEAAQKALADAQEALDKAKAGLGDTYRPKGPLEPGCLPGTACPAPETPADSSPPPPPAAPPSGVWPDCGSAADLCLCEPGCKMNQTCSCTFVPGPLVRGPFEFKPGTKGKAPGDAEASTPDGLALGRSTTTRSAPSRGETKSPDAQEPTTGEPVPEPPPATPPDTPPKPPDEEIVAEVRKALNALATEAEEIDKRLDLVASGILQILAIRKLPRSAGHEKALRKYTEEFSILLSARGAVVSLAEEAVVGSVVALSSTGNERQQAAALVAEVGAVASTVLKEVDRRLAVRWRPVSDPDAVIRQLRRKTEAEVERRWNAEGGDRETIRNEVLSEEDAQGAGASWVNSRLEGAANAATELAELWDTVVRRPLRANVRLIKTPAEYLVRELLGIEHPETYDPWARTEAGRYAREEAEFFGGVSGALGLPAPLARLLEGAGAVQGAAHEVLFDQTLLLGGGGSLGRIFGGRVLTSEASSASGALVAGEMKADSSLRLPAINLAGEGEVAGVANQNLRHILGPHFTTSRGGLTLSELRALPSTRGFVVSTNEALPFRSAFFRTVYANWAPVGGNTMFGPGIQLSEVARILRSGGRFIFNGRVYIVD